MKKETFILPSDIDKECSKLVLKLNQLSNIRTTECCCGHLKERYVVFFQCDDFVRLGKLFRCVNRNYSDGKWRIEVDGSDMQPSYEFMLTSKEPFNSYEEMMKSVNALIDNIDYWEDPKFNDYFETKLD